MMKYILTILTITLLFLTACGNEETIEDNLTENISEVTEELDTEIDNEPEVDIDCDEGYVAIDGECLPIDPYNIIKDEDEEEEVIIEESQVEVVEDVVSGSKTFKIQAQNYEFLINGVENPDIKVKVNDTVIIELTSIDGSHNWNVRQLAARSATVSTNESTTLEFVAHTAGTYDYYCAVGKHQNIGQEGKFIVE